MGQAAVRFGDMTSHGTPLNASPGSTNVLIGGKPAWRALIDVHICPLFSGNVPHIGGVVPQASTTVFINGSPAVRMNDDVMENGLTNKIVSGEVTVLIG